MSAEAPGRPLALVALGIALAVGAPLGLRAAWPLAPLPVLAVPPLAVAGAFLFWVRRVVKAPRRGDEE